jgi:hypothetical protein
MVEYARGKACKNILNYTNKAQIKDLGKYLDTSHLNYFKNV